MKVKINVDVAVYFLSPEAEAAIALIPTILTGVQNMAETQAEAAVRLEQLGGKLDKISGETTRLVEAARDLKTKVGTADPAVTAAIDKLLGQATSIDEKVDDLAPTPTPTPPGDTGTAPTP